MDRDHVIDRLPTGRLPRFGDEESDDTVAAESSDGLAEPIDLSIGESEEGPSRREKIRKLLLGVSLVAVALAVLAVLLRRLLGGSDEGADEGGEPDSESGTAESDSTAVSEDGEPDLESEAAAAEPADVGPEPILTPDAEGVAAMIGLGFQLLVRALNEEDESESPTP